MAPGLALLAMLAELLTGYPERLFRVVGHPVTWIGRLIDTLEQRLNAPGLPAARRKQNGLLALAVVVLVAVGAGSAVQTLATGTVGMLIVVVLAGSLLAQRSLAGHVSAVAAALEAEGLTGGRVAVARIVGRDPEGLDVAGVARAAVESLAENFSDGVVAPVFWLAVAGLPGAAGYKAINTADSMIGHRSPRYLAFGRCAARLDDLANLPASRLSAMLLVGAAGLLPGASMAGAWRTLWRDAGGHASPNAGWPESAMAGALGFELGGPRRYGGVLVEGAVIGRGGRRALEAADIRRALRLYWIADALLGLLILLAALAVVIARG